MSTSFTRLTSYIDRLPQGLDTYADYRCRASVYRSISDQVDLSAFPFDSVPPPIRTLLKNPFLHDGWLPEAHVMATIFALTDFRGLDDDATVQWLDECNGRLLNSRMYRTIMSLASPSILIAFAPRQWSVLHRGTKMRVERGPVTRAYLDYPEKLYDAVLARAIGSGVRHAMALSRAKNPTVELESCTTTRATYVLRWN